MALTKDQLALITWLERPDDDRPATKFPRRRDSGTGGAGFVCQLEGLGAPSHEDIRAAQLELRAMTDLERHKLNAERDYWSYERAAE